MDVLMQLLLDSLYPNISKTSHHLKLTMTIWSFRKNGQVTCSITITLKWLLRQEDQQYQKSTLSNYSKTLVFWETKLGIDILWTNKTMYGSQMRKERKFKTQRPSPSIWLLPKEKVNFRLISTNSMRKFQVLSVSQDPTSTSRPTMLNWEFDVLLRLKIF